MGWGLRAGGRGSLEHVVAEKHGGAGQGLGLDAEKGGGQAGHQGLGGHL